MPNDNLSKYKRQSHSTYDCRYHVVWITKYRYKILNNEMEISLKWILKDICDWKDIEILEGAVGEEHVHLYLSIPPKYSLSDVLKWLKGKSAERLFKKYPKLKETYWGKHLWARGYFVSTIGITDNIIRQYIKKHQNEEKESFEKKWD